MSDTTRRLVKPQSHSRPLEFPIDPTSKIEIKRGQASLFTGTVASANLIPPPLEPPLDEPITGEVDTWLTLVWFIGETYRFLADNDFVDVFQSGSVSSG